MAPDSTTSTTITTADPTQQIIHLNQSAEEEVTPCEAISHGDVLPSK